MRLTPDRVRELLAAYDAAHDETTRGDATTALYGAAPMLAAALLAAHAALAAERERAEAAERALATARADALREAAALCRAINDGDEGCQECGNAGAGRCADAIAALAGCP